MGYRSMSADRALETIRRVLEYSPRCSLYLCVDNILDKSYLVDVFPKVNVPPDAAIAMEVKADLNESELRTLSQAGVRCVQPGIEALSTKSLKLMKKGVSAIQNVALLRSCAMTNVLPWWAILVGSPGETADIYEKYCRDIPLVVHLPPPMDVSIVRFDRYSVYHMRPEEFGIELEPSSYYEMTYPFRRDALHQIAYFFDDPNRFRKDYFIELAKSFNRLRELVRGWNGQWHDPNREPPRLFFEERNGSSTIYDSRSGESLRHHVGAPGTALLTRLEAPMRLSALGSELEGVGAAEVEDELARLSERGLIFEEDGRAISLVFPTEPPAWRPCGWAGD
jgi:magnesium-protoporphyrin IX monomethyl ester (oxidative) cyclase